jgi:hypothetical protein
VQGIVIDSSTGKPLVGVTVLLRERGGTALQVVADTREDGTFAFSNLPPGSYLIEATRAGYVPVRILERDTTAPVLTIAPGQSPSRISITLTPGAVVYGRIIDDKGEVVVGAVIEALKTTHENGLGRRTVVRRAATNDLGEYRLFALLPGEYVIRATRPSLGAASLAFNNIETPPIYFPGTIDANEARTLPLRAGEVAGGVDFFTFPTRTIRLTGQVLGANGEGTTVLLFPRNSETPMEQTVDPASGTFEFREVLPGRYVLFAQSMSQRAALPLDVGNVDVSDLRITLGSGYQIPAVVRIDGHAAGNDPALEKLYFAVRPEPAIPGMEVGIYSPFSDGHFTPSLLAGDYRIDLDRPDDYYIKSMRLGGVDVLTGGLRVTSSSDAPLEILVGANPGAVEGRAAKEGVTVVLVPDGPRRGQRALYKSVKAGASGEFRLAKVPPGDYKLFSWQAENGGPWLDPEYLSRYESGGIPIHVDEGRPAAAGRTIPVLD